MGKLSMCRICLVENVRMCVVTNKSLQETYEKLTDVPFVTEDHKPMRACLFCCTRLKQCCQLQRQCVEAEALLAHMLSEDYEQKPLTDRGHLEFVGGFIISPIENISIADDCQIGSDAIKQELPAVCKEQGDVELQPAQPTEELNTKNLYNNHQEEVQLVMDFKIEREEEHELSENLRVRERERAAVATKQTLKRKSEDTNPAKQTMNVLSGSKINRTTETSISESVAKIKEPITTACQSSLSQSSNLIQYTLLHTGGKLLKCEVCQRCFYNKSNFYNHFRLHTGEKLFKCEVCQRSFGKKCNLNSHFRLHTGKKLVKCDICQRSFCNKSNLNSHFRIHTGEKPFKCDVCQRSFCNKSNLNSHYRVHTGEKPYKCDICQYSCSQKISLKEHRRLHTGEKPYKCDVCQHSFIRRSSLIIHLKKHSGEKPFKCDVCQSKFLHKSSLKLHSRKHLQI